MSSQIERRAVYGSKALAIIVGTTILLSAIVAVYVLPEASSASKVALLLGAGFIYLLSIIAAFTPKGGKLRAGILILVVLALAAMFSYFWVHYGLALFLSGFGF